METLTLNDGTVLEGHILDNGDGMLIYVYLDNKTLAEGYTVFSDTENIRRIVAMNHGTEHVYEGYTQIVAINTQYGNCNLTMRKE